jgi:hypothetical protein
MLWFSKKTEHQSRSAKNTTILQPLPPAEYCWHTTPGTPEARAFVEEVVAIALALPDDRWQDEIPQQEEWRGWVAFTNRGAKILVRARHWDDNSDCKLFLDGQELGSYHWSQANFKMDPVRSGYDGIDAIYLKASEITAQRRRELERPAHEAKEAADRRKAQEEALAEKRRLDDLRRRL